MPVLSTLGAAIANVYGFTSGLIKDQYFNLVSLLLPGNGTNGAQNNTFLDSSSNTFTITRNGNTTQGTFSPFSQTGWGGAFNTSTTYLTVTDTANLRFGLSNFTIEAWVYRNASGATQTIASKGASTPTGWVFQISSADKLVFTDTSTSITGTTSIAANTWTYVAVVRAGTGASQTTLYVNGTSDGTGTSATNFNQTSNMLIGADRSTTNFANGYISNLRLSNTNRTISSTPTTALTADANTIFLSLNLNRFQYTDSTAAYTNISVTGTPSVVPFSPFAPTQSYSAAAVGGSGYFDGTGDYLEIANNAAFDLPADFTVEAWVYCTSTANAGNTIMGKWATAFAWAFYVNPSTGAVSFFYGNNGSFVNAVDFGTSVKPYTWAHIAITRQGTDVKAYVNGTQVGTTQTISSNLTATSVEWIGRDDNASRYLTGYISNIRVVKGQALSTGNFTPPSAPVTASAVGWSGANAASSITGTVSLVANFTNAGVVDATAKNVLETVGNAQISTTQSKWGGGSISFDGTGDYLYKPYDPLLNQLNGNFTIECWIYPTVTNTRMIFAGSVNSSGVTNWYFEITSANKLRFEWDSTSTFFEAVSSASISQNTWTYVAVVRNGGTITQYINGSADGTASPTGTYKNASYPFAIGRPGDTNSLYFTGYIDDFRMTIGQARTITASPTAPFPVQ